MALGPLVQGLASLATRARNLGGRSPSARMDEMLKIMRTGEQAGDKFSRLTQSQLDDMLAKYGRETQALTDSVTRGSTSITSQAGYARKAQELLDKGADVERLIKILEHEMKLAKTMSESRRLLERLNRMRKVDSLIKGTIAAMGAGGAGMYFGASEQRKNPDFYNPEDNPFRGLFGSPERQMGSGVAYDAVGEALEDMDNKINGREQ